jgi:hypothetical protein
MSSRHGAKVAKRINEHFLQLRSDGVGFMYTERSNTMFLAYGCVYDSPAPSLVCWLGQLRTRTDLV